MINESDDEGEDLLVLGECEDQGEKTPTAKTYYSDDGLKPGTIMEYGMGTMELVQAAAMSFYSVYDWLESCRVYRGIISCRLFRQLFGVPPIRQARLS